MVAARKLGHFSLQSELGEWEEKLSKVETPFDGPFCAMCYFALCLGALMAKHLPDMGKDVALRVTGFQGQAGRPQPLFRGAAAAGWDTVWGVHPPKVMCWTRGCVGTLFCSARSMWARCTEYRDYPP